MRKALALCALVAGLLVAGGGVASGGLLAVLNMLAGGVAGLQGAVLTVGLALLGLLYGAPLAWAGARAYRGTPASPLRMPGWGWHLLAIAVLLALGVAAYRVPGLSSVALPPIHLALAALPGLLIVALVAGIAAQAGSIPVTRRSAIAGYAWGGFAASGLALIAETILMIVLALAAGAWLQMANPGALDEIRAWAEAQAGQTQPDLAPLLPWLRSPLVLLGAFGFLGAAAPAIEEFAKTLIVPIVAAGRPRLTRLDAFLLGVAAGAGFAALEAVFYGAMGLTGPTTWAGLMISRGATAAIHCLSSGFGALAWQAVLVERRWARGLLFALLAALLHGVWNATALGQAVVALTRTSGASGLPTDLPGLTVTFMLTGFMVILWVGAMVALVLIGRQVAASSRPPEA